MRNRLPVFIVFVTAFAQAEGQARPDFSGEWTRVDSVEQRSVAAVGDAAFRVGTMGSGWGSPLTVRQDANRLVVEYRHFGTYDLQPPLRFTFALDGSESSNSIMIGHAESLVRSRAAWRDSTLVITMTYPAPQSVGGPVEVRQTLKLESPGSLVVETTRAGVPGATSTRTSYRKS